MKERDTKIQDLKVEIVVARFEVIRMKVELSATIKMVRNWAFGYSYGARLQHFKSFLVINPESDVNSLNLEGVLL